MDAFCRSDLADTTQVNLAYEISETQSGLVIVKWNRAATTEESRGLMRRIERLWSEERRYACVMITHPSVDADTRHRRLWSEWHEANRDSINRFCCGTVVVSGSAGLRALMTVMSWFSKDAYPVKFVASEREARAWAASRLLEL